MRVRRVAIIADVHGNAVSLAAVLLDLERERPDAVVHCGDLTWGLMPDIVPRRTEYDIDEAERCYRDSDDPPADELVEMLRRPPTPAEVIAHAESLALSG